MWLLSTDRAELHYFASPESVPAGYAILSHVWGSEEQSFKFTASLQTECMTSLHTPRDLSSPKVRRACILAQEQGYRWIWNDTCCIDKTSSAALSEAINSMYKYYALADVCYAYLSDVPGRAERQDLGQDLPDLAIITAFRASRWHLRGWTLQELLFPPNVLFLDREWEAFGSKIDLAVALEEITRIPAQVLRLEVRLESISIAGRMSWAAGRQTTRVEDEAYCLLGIFSITMSARYGEGRNAFQRLQEEIMKQYLDTTLFAWGRRWRNSEEAAAYANHAGIPYIHTDESYLLAPAPSAFRNCGDIVHVVPVPRKQESSLHRSMIC